MAKGGKLVMDQAVIAGDPNLPEIVYCYRFPSRRDRIKIGYSSRGLRRIVEQSTGFPENPEVVFVIHDHNAAAIEKLLHEQLAGKQAPVLGREWFMADIKDVLAVSPILRKAAKKEKWRSGFRLFEAGALFGLGIFLMPLMSLAALELSSVGQDIAGWHILSDYVKSPFVEEISTLQLGRLIFDSMQSSGFPWFVTATTIASPAAFAGLAYCSFKKQVA